MSFPRAVWILFAGTFINRFGTFVMPFLVIYLTRNGVGAARAGVAISAYGAGHFLASILGGHLADRIGRRLTIAWSMLVSCIAMLALSQARAYAAILAIVFVAGAASEMYRPAAAALIGDLVSEERRVTAFAMFRFALNLGFAAGPATAGLLAARSFSWLFVGDALTSLTFAVIAFVALPSGAPAPPPVRAGEAPAPRFSRPFVLFLASMLCVTWIEYQVTSVFPLIVHDPRKYGFLISLNGALVACFELAITAWTRRHAPQRILALGYVLYAFGFALTGMAPLIAVVIWTAGEMIFAPVTGAYTTNLAPAESRGRYQGMLSLTWSVGVLLGPWLGMLLYAHNASAYFAAVACAGVIGASLVLASSREPRSFRT